MKKATLLLGLSLLLAGGMASPACWMLAYDPHGPLVEQRFQARVYTPFNLSPSAGSGVWLDQLGFYDATGSGLTRDVVVGIANLYDTAVVTVPAGPATRESGGFRWADLDHDFFPDPSGGNYLFYLGEPGDVVRLANPWEVSIHPFFELAGNGYYADFPGPGFAFPPDSGMYAFGANAQYVPEPSQYAMMLVTLLAAGVVAWRQRAVAGTML
jgi:hypothetical protein